MLDNPTFPSTLGATDFINGKAIDNNDPIPSPIIIFLFFFESVNLYVILLFFNKLLNCVLFKNILYFELSFNLFLLISIVGFLYFCIFLFY